MTWAPKTIDILHVLAECSSFERNKSDCVNQSRRAMLTVIQSDDADVLRRVIPFDRNALRNASHC
jgi:hypothetical protein